MRLLKRPGTLERRRFKRHRARSAAADRGTRGSGSRLGWRWVALTVEGWCYVLVLGFVFLGALIRDINLLMVLFGLLAGVLAYSLLYVRWALGRVRAERRLPEQLVCGVPCDVQVTSINPRRWLTLWSVAIEDRIAPASTPAKDVEASAGLLFWRLPPRHSQRLAYQFRPPSRGKYRFGPLTAVTRFPFGLVRGSRVLAGAQEALVWPALGRLHARSRRWLGQVDRSIAQSNAARAGRTGEFHSLRDWRPGDTPRWVHWRTTARVGELMVRQFEQHRDPELAVLLDLWKPRESKGEDDAAVESAVSFAATLLAELCRRRGARISVLLPPAPPLCLHRVATPTILGPLLDALALAAPQTDPLDEVLLAGSAALRPDIPTLFISTRDPENTRARTDRSPSVQGRLTAWLRRVEIVSVRSPLCPEYFSVSGLDAGADLAGSPPSRTSSIAHDLASNPLGGTSLFSDSPERALP
ncbi:MAG: DUF58 domain-containing protein [Pirellulales bacterium]|nr:DUF58 domain-containing protein [Pirellulales bacterium]